jgi:hypothetical protein
MVQKDPAFFRIAWYSGKYLPACRINQIGGGQTGLRSSTDARELTLVETFMSVSNSYFEMMIMVL